MGAPSRIRPAAAEALRAAIREAEASAGAGVEVEVFAIGDVEDGEITGITLTCRGREDRVLALVDRPRAGQVVIHNHPSGDLRPSDADLQLAHRYGEDGVGFVIIRGDAAAANWVVEPHAPRAVPVDLDALDAFFRDGLPRALPGWEARPQQVEMARRIAAAFDEDRPVVIEAGTGTGKSLAYLVPAALWAQANGGKVAISTFTRSLQAQLLQSDLPLLAAGGIAVRSAVLQGRNNYLCRRRLALADDEDTELDRSDRQELDALLDWARNTADGLRIDLPFAVEPALWERVMSDSDLTLSVRCPHYQTCCYYQARRKAAAADLLVLNHALFLADRNLVAQSGRGVLPKVQRVVLDEAHHLEDAATGAGADRLTALAVRRAIAPLLDTPRRKGALSRLVKRFADDRSPLSAAARTDLEVQAGNAASTLDALSNTAQHLAEQIADRALDAEGNPLRVTDAFAETDAWVHGISPDVHHLSHELHLGSEQLAAIEALFDDVRITEADAQPLMDLRRGRRRLGEQGRIAAAFLEPAGEIVRWIEPARSRRGDRGAAVCAAPIEVAGLLRRILWDPLPGTACTSATLAVGDRFTFWQRRHGLEEVETAILPSPFDHAAQAILGLPKDLPLPDDPGWLTAIAAATSDAVTISDGGAFVLCTSHALVRDLARALRERGDRLVLAQGDVGRTVLLERFRDDPRAVLVGTDAFWEGVSVRGDALRLVVIPRLPFRVPSEPLLQARHEQVRARGLDPFLAYSLPEAVIKLRQGYGRLIRSRTDRGAVLILDRRIHERRYGQVMLHALPPARRVKGPWKLVGRELAALFAATRGP